MERLLRAQDGHRADQGLVGRNTDLRTSRRPPHRLHIGDAVGEHPHLPGVEALQLDHLTPALLGNGEIGRRPPPDQEPVGELSPRAALERPVVVVRDHNRHLPRGPEQGRPEVGPEEVRVEHVDVLVLKRRHKPPPARGRKPRPAREPDEPPAPRLETGEELRDHRIRPLLLVPARRAHPALEAVRVEARRDRARHRLAPADAPSLVEHRHHPERPGRVGAHGMLPSGRRPP